MASTERLVMACFVNVHGGYMQKIVPYLKRNGRRVDVELGHVNYAWLLHKKYNNATIVLWNGANEKHTAAIAELRKRRPAEQARLIFAEVGWFPGAPVKGSGKTLYLDRYGINALSEIRRFALPHSCTEEMRTRLAKARAVTWAGATPASVKPADRYTFVPLQLPRDSNIKVGSPHFLDMQRLINFVEKTIPGKLVFKRHPRDKLAYTTSRADSTFLTSGELCQIFAGARQVIGINSTVLLEALDYGLKVAACGIGLFTGRNALLECHEDLGRLAQLETWVPDRACIDALMYELRFRRQVWLPNPQQSLSENRVLQELGW